MITVYLSLGLIKVQLLTKKWKNVEWIGLLDELFLCVKRRNHSFKNMDYSTIFRH